MNYVVADMAAAVDSPLYGMFSMRGDVAGIATPGGGSLVEYFIHPPDDPYRNYSISGTGSRKSPTKRSATWAPPMRWVSC